MIRKEVNIVEEVKEREINFDQDLEINQIN